MISVPAMKLTNLGAVKIVLGSVHFAIYMVFVLANAFATGAFVDGLRIRPRWSNRREN